jgi:hypothetical protein
MSVSAPPHAPVFIIDKNTQPEVSRWFWREDADFEERVVGCMTRSPVQWAGQTLCVLQLELKADSFNRKTGRVVVVIVRI